MVIKLENKHRDAQNVIKTTQQIASKMSEVVENKVASSLKVLFIQIFSQKMAENLISDLLDLAKLERSQFRVNFEYFNLLDTIYGAFEVMKYNAVLRKVSLRSSLNNEDHLEFLKQIEGDPNRFMQIFLNIVSNSIKFTPDYGGWVEVEVKINNFQNLLNAQNMSKIERRI